MFSIGEFSKITGLTIKTLRFYHERGVLVPVRVEAGSGYRYYDERNVETARAISALRDFEFPLDEIVEILREHSEEADILTFLQRRKDLLKNRIQRDRDLVDSIDRIIQREKETRQMKDQTTFVVEIKTVPPLLVAGIRMTGRYDECGKAFGRLGRSVGRHVNGPPLCLMYDDEYREEDANFEPCLPVSQRATVEGIDCRKLPEQRCLSLVHRGPYKELGRSYEKLIRHAKEAGYVLGLPSREVYLKGPGWIFKGNPNKYLTEILIPFQHISPQD